MSLMTKLFGGSSGQSKQHVDPNAQAKLTGAIQQINEQIDAFGKKKEQIEKRIAQELAQAKAAVKANKGNKQKAMPFMKRKARLEKQMQQIEGIIENMEAQRFSLETASLNKGAVDAMSAGQQAIRAQGIDADKLADELDDIQEDMQRLEEVTDMLSQPILGAPVDEDDLMAELDAELESDLQDELLDTDVGMAMPDTPLDMPAVPQSTPQATAQAEDDDELANLAAWAN